MYKLKSIPIFIIAFLAIVLFGCNKQNTTEPVADTGKLLIVHASPDGQGMDVYIDNQKIKSNVIYPGNTGYVEIKTGSHTVKVTLTGSSTPLFSRSLNVAAKTSYSLFVCDTIGNVTPISTTDDLSAPEAGKARIRFVNLSPNGNALDFAVKSGPVLAGCNNKKFKEISQFISVLAGSYNFEVRSSNSAPRIMLTLMNVQLQAGKVYTIFLKGFVGATGAKGLGYEMIVHQ
jgi:hypothetical protein